MKVLIVGGGGREHALAWKVTSSAQVDRVYVAPGNAGTAREPKAENVAIAADDLAALLAFAESARIDLTLVGSEAPLVAGIVDRFEEAGLRCFGPSGSAAALEGSKIYAKSFMDRHGIATAPYASFSHLHAASAYIRAQALPLVIKANGLAAGKGVVIAQSAEEAVSAASDMLAGHAFGSAGQEIVVEGFLQGEEASFIVVSDGIDVLPLASSQDHKARDCGDCGPNTGGMGAYSPAPVVTQAVSDRVMSEIVLPTIRAMAEEGRPYRGFLYVGVMVAPDGTPRVLEYNCRLGDPEAEVILFRLRSDLVEIIEAGHRLPGSGAGGEGGGSLSAPVPAQKVTEQGQSRLLALLGMELHREDMAARDRGGKPHAILRIGSAEFLILGCHEIAVDEVKALAGRNTCPQRMRTRRPHLIPTHVRHL